MPIPKGKTNNPNGRPKGVPNKVTNELRGWIFTILNDGKEKFEQDLADLMPTERVRVFLSLLGYAVPKMSALDPQRYLEAEKRMIEELLISMPDRALSILADKLKKIDGDKIDK